MASAFNVSGLTAYVQEDKEQLFYKTALGAPTLKYIDLMVDVKNKARLHYLDSTVTLADGKSCGFSANGSDVFSEREISVMPVKVNKEWCYKDILGKFAEGQVRIEAGLESLPFEQQLMESNTGEINKAVEKMIWQGDAGLGFSGLCADLSADTAVSAVTVNSGSSATQLIDAVVEKISNDMYDREGGIEIFVAPSTLRQYIKEQNAICCPNHPVIVDRNTETLPYPEDSRITIVSVKGLEGAAHQTAVAATHFNLTYATDVMDSEKVFKLWYSEDADMFRFAVLFNAGVAYKFPDEIVYGTKA